MGTIIVFNNAEELARANFLTLVKTIDRKEIPIANYDNICIYKKYITIMGMDNINCYLLGNKTNIVVDYEGKVTKYSDCIVKGKLEDGYIIEYSREDII